MRPNKIDDTRKKSHCLRNCLITIIVMTVLIFGGLFGGAYYAYGRFAEPMLGISLFDVFGILGGIGKYNEKEIVTNAYTEADRTAFYSNLENATCLDLPEGFAISTAVNEVLASQAQAGGGQPADPNQPVDPNQSVDPAPMAGVDVPGEPTPVDPAPAPDPEPTPSDPFQSIKDFKTGNEYLDSVLRETGFDFSQLQDFDGSGKDLAVTDKQFAAIMDEVISNLSVPQLNEMLAKWGLKISDLVKLKQVTISGVPSVETALAGEPEPVPTPGVDTPVITDPLRANVKISLVLCLNLDKNLAKILKAEAPQIPPILADMANGILPKKIFVGVGVYPYDGTKHPEIFVNGIAGKVMDNLLTAVNGVMSQSNPDSTVDALLDKVSNVVTTTINKMEEMVGELRFVDSSLEMDPIALLMNVLKVNVPDPETGSTDHYVNSSNFFMMLKHLYNTDNTIGSLDINTYIDKNVGAENRISADSYRNDLANLQEAYGIEKTADFDMSTWTPADFMTKVKDIPAHLNVVDAKIGTKHVYEVSQEEMVAKTLISDNAIGYIVNDLITTKLKESLAGLPFDMQVASFVLYAPEGKPDAVMARFTAGVNTLKLANDLNESNAVLSKLITSVIPKYLFLEVEVPLTNDAGSAGLVLNFLGRDGKGDGISKEEMDKGYNETKEAFGTLVRILAAFDKPTADKLEIEALIAMLESKIEELLVQLEGQLSQLFNKDTAPSPAPDPSPAPAMAAGDGTAPVEPPVETPIVNKLIKAGGIQMPTVYDIIKVFAGNDSAVKPQDIQQALADMYTFTTETAQPSDVINDFITRELEGKLFMINKVDPVTKEKEINASNVFTAMQNLGDKVQTEGVGAVINARGLIEDTTHPTVESLRLSVKATELAAVINSSDQISAISGSMPYGKIAVASGANIVNVAGDFYMNITLMLSDIDPTKAIDGVGILYKNLLPSEVYVKANVKMTGDVDKYQTKIYINSIDDVTKATIDKILSNLMKDEAGNPTVSFAKIESTIAEQMQNALASLEASGQSLSFDATDGGSLVAMSIYDVIYDQVMKSQIDTLIQEGKITEADAVEIRGADGKQGPSTIMTLFKKLLANTAVTTINGDTLDALASDLSNKMLLADGVLDGNDLFGSIGKITDTSTGENIFAKLSTAKLWLPANQFDVLSNMNIAIKEGELLTIMRDKIATIPFTLPDICKSPAVESLAVNMNRMDIVLSVGVNHASTDPAFIQILPFMPEKIVLKVSVDFSTGEGSTSLLMNDLDASNMKTANTLMTIMTAGSGTSAFDLDKITLEIDTQLKGVFKTMTDVGLALTFGDKQVTSGNIFDVIVNADKTRFSSITAEELHTVIYKGLHPSAKENYVNGDALTNLSTELNNKMLLKDGTIDASDMFGSISGITGDVFARLDLNKLWIEQYHFDDVANMDIVIKQGEMLTIMREKLQTISLTGLPTMFGAPVVDNMVVAKDRMQIELKIDIDKTQADAESKDIVSFMPDKLVLHIDMDVLNGTATMLMNNLESADIAVATKVFKALSFDLDSISNEMGTQIMNVLNTMKDAGLELAFNDGGNITTGCIYDVMRKADTENKFTAMTNAEIHSVFRGIYAPKSEQDKYIINPKPAVLPTDGDMFGVDINIPTNTLTATITDYYIANKVFTGAINNSSGNKIGDVLQMAILTGDGLARAKSVLGDNINIASRGILLSVNVQTADFNKGSTGVSSVIPQELMISLSIDIPTTASATTDIKVQPVINNMTRQDMINLEKLLGGNSMIGDIATALNEQIFGVEIPLGDSGITLKLGDILISNDTSYVNNYVASGDYKGIFGKLVYSRAIA